MYSNDKNKNTIVWKKITTFFKRHAYHMYHSIPLTSCDYLKKISIQINVASDEGNSRNEIGH